MNADKKYASRGLEGARRATARSVDESPQGTASPRPAVIVPPDPEVVATCGLLVAPPHNPVRMPAVKEFLLPQGYRQDRRGTSARVFNGNVTHGDTLLKSVGGLVEMGRALVSLLCIAALAAPDP